MESNMNKSIASKEKKQRSQTNKSSPSFYGKAADPQMFALIFGWADIYPHTASGIWTPNHPPSCKCKNHY